MKMKMQNRANKNPNPSSSLHVSILLVWMSEDLLTVGIESHVPETDR